MVTAAPLIAFGSLLIGFAAGRLREQLRHRSRVKAMWTELGRARDAKGSLTNQEIAAIITFWMEQK